MKAKRGDRMTVRGHKVGESERHGVIIDVRGKDGAPPYIVQWDNEEGEHLMFPGSDAVITSKK